MDTIWISAFSGGLAGALLTTVAQSLLRWRNEPILGASFDPGVRGCLVTTPAIPQIVQRYLRVRITNKGRSVAREVSVSMIHLKNSMPDSKDVDFQDEVLDLRWSLTDVTKIDIPSKGHRFIDIMHLEAPRGTADTDDASAIFDFFKTPQRLPELGWGHGRYQATIFISADNATSKVEEIEWVSDGTFAGLRIVSR